MGSVASRTARPGQHPFSGRVRLLPSSTYVRHDDKFSRASVQSRVGAGAGVGSWECKPWSIARRVMRKRAAGVRMIDITEDLTRDGDGNLSLTPLLLLAFLLMSRL